MDDVLVKLVKLGKSQKENNVVEVLDLAGNVEVKTAEGKPPYKLKPLKDLYGPGINADTFDPASEEYMPLCMGIETEILECWEEDSALTDGQVSLALDRAAISPEADAGHNRLLLHLQWALRFQLSLGDFSRRDVQRALRRISRSVTRHTREAGPRGYLVFIRKYLGE